MSGTHPPLTTRETPINLHTADKFTYANGLTHEDARAINGQISSIECKSRLSQADIREVSALRRRLGKPSERAGLSKDEWTKRFHDVHDRFNRYEIGPYDAARILNEELCLFGVNPHAFGTKERVSQAQIEQQLRIVNQVTS